jgi:dephospho-CoA kinase
MLTSRKVAVTGNISSGKSTFCAFLKKYGAIVVDADQIVHELLSSAQTNLGKQVLQLLGNTILENGKISRKKIANEVFNHPQKLDALEKLLHPYVFEEIERLYREEKKKHRPFIFVVEMPLLFETKKEKEYDVIVTLIRKEETCRAACKTGNFDERSYRLLPIEEKKQRSHFVIENNGSLECLEDLAKNLMKVLTTHVV